MESGKKELPIKQRSVIELLKYYFKNKPHSDIEPSKNLWTVTRISLIGVGILGSIILVIVGMAGRNLELKAEILKDILRQEDFQNKETSIPDTSITTLKVDSYKISSTPPAVSAKAYLVYDLKNDKKIYGKGEDMQLPPASVTKIMTAVIALENFDLSKPVIVPSQCVGINGANVGFQANEMFTLEDLIYGLLVRSGADAACTIANIYNNEADYVATMNNKAIDIGMVNTKYQNEIGFDARSEQLTTINDLEKLSKYALRSSIFRKIVGTKKVDINALNTKNVYSLVNTNDLLFTIPGTVGIKTGTTFEAGQCLTYLYENKGNEILIIILGSQNRFADTSQLLKWSVSEIEAANQN